MLPKTQDYWRDFCTSLGKFLNDNFTKDITYLAPIEGNAAHDESGNKETQNTQAIRFKHLINYTFYFDILTDCLPVLVCKFKK